MKRLYVFDMDGTLLPHTTGMLEIAKISGHAEVLKSLEKQLFTQQIRDEEFSMQVLNLWKALPLDTVKKAFLSAPKLNNIKTVLQTIAKEGNTSCLITASQAFFAHHFYDYGFDYIFASEEISLQTQQLKPERALRTKDKVPVAQQLCARLNLRFTDTVAFGDSISDVPLFQHLTHTISMNGDHHISKIAAHHYHGLDLLEAYHRLQLQ